MDQKTLLNKLYKENGLTKDDVFQHKHFTIITRSGIEKIQYKNKIVVQFQPVAINTELAVIKAIGVKQSSVDPKNNKMIETFGEWNMTHAKKDKQGNVVPYYSVALAEKRALSRVVLKLMNFYEHGVLGEDEEIFEAEASDGQKDYIRSLMGTSVYEEHQLEKLEAKIDELSAQDAEMAISELQANQKDPIASGDNYGLREINAKLDKHE